MTRTSGNRHRHRRGRGGGQENTNQVQEQVAAPEARPQAEVAAPQETQSRRPPRWQAPPPRREEHPGEASAPPEQGRGRGPERPQGSEGRQGQARPNRRRQGRRPQVLPSTGAIFRRNVRQSPAAEAPARHTLGPEQEPPVLGCPMLTRTLVGMPTNGGQSVPRCALAWAIHSEAEARYCLATPDLTQCWKTHAERIPGIEAALHEQGGD